MVVPAEPTPTKAKRKAQITKKRAADAASTAGVILDTLDAFGQELTGSPSGGFEPLERALMEDPLGRILARTDPTKLGQYASILDPLLLATGGMLYAMRLSKVIGEKREASKPSAPPLSQVLKATPESDPRSGGRIRQSLMPEGGPIS